MIVINGSNLQRKALAFLLWFVSILWTVTSFDCNIGCDLDPTVNGKLVCGEDGIIYMNKCLAKCQGVKVVTAGTSAGNCLLNITTFDDENVDWNTFLAIETIEKFKDDGFKFIIKWDTLKYKTGDARKESDFNFTSLSRTTLPTNDYQISRLTHEGYEYVTKARSETNTLRTFDMIKTYNGYIPPNIPLKRNRNLDIIGRDTRTRVNPTTVYPYSTVVAMNYDDGNDVGYCSGIVIAPDAVLTAGHCVYLGGWEGHSDITPALNTFRNAPYGRWKVSEIFTYSQWRSRGDTDYDIAVVRYFPNEKNESVGSVVGYVGLAAVEDVESDENLQYSTITGYPSDGPYQMWTTGECSSNFYTTTWNPFKVFYGCDTVGGMSGAAIVGPDNKARGVHTTGGYSINSGTLLRSNSPHYDNVLIWAGLKTGTSTTPEQKCTCRWWQFICRLRYRCVI